MPRPRFTRAIAVALITIIMVIVLEAVSLLGIYALSSLASIPIRRKATIYAEQSSQIRSLLEGESHRREQINPLLGWNYRAGFEKGGDRINAQGARSLRTYEDEPPPDVLRIAAFGDSFVYGNEVDTREAWPARMEALFPNVEVLNYGVGGFGLDQAFLRYHQDGHTLDPRVVIVGFVADDLRRLVNVYRRFIADNESPLAKPRFVLGDNGALTLIPAPLPNRAAYERVLADPSSVRALGQHDQWYEPAVYDNPLYDYLATVRLASTVWIRLDNRYLDSDRIVADGVFNRNSEAYRLQVAIFERFARDITQAGARPHIVLFPDRSSLAAELDGLPPVYAPLAEDLERLGIPYSDLSPDFREAVRTGGVDALFRPGGHYSPAGNDVAAKAIGRALGAGR